MKKIFITGGAGFIGINLAYSFVKNKNNFVVIYDNLSRKGVENNLSWLFSFNFSNLKFIQGDVRDYKKLMEVVENFEEIYHLAAQVAVTKSVEEPVEDFKINAEGTLYLLESVRKKSPDAKFIFSSTNKVYGELSHLKLKEGKKRYYLIGKRDGIDESVNLDFHSPYGCSKGTADQYVRDYYRIYRLKTVVFRQSCICGPMQFGNEDQGWVAHFIIKSFLGEKINIYGNGKQVRDILEVSDLIKAYKIAAKKINKTQGEVYNIGGGKENTFSLLDLIEYLEKVFKRKIDIEFFSWRPGDQRVFISNNKKFMLDTGWEIKLDKFKSVNKLIKWVEENIEVIKKVRK